MRFIIALLLLSSLGSYGQLTTLAAHTYSYDIVKTKYDTTVLNGGDTILCPHKFVKKTVSKNYGTCAVFHDAAGCPDTWVNEFSICRFCLRHIHVKESRFVEQPAKEETYDELLNKLNNKKQ